MRTQKSIKYQKNIILSIITLLIIANLSPLNTTAKTKMAPSIIMLYHSNMGIDDVADSIEAVILDSHSLKDYNTTTLLELLNSGITLFRIKKDGKKLSRLFGKYNIHVGDNTVGYALKKVKGRICATSIGLIIQRDDGKKATKKDYKDLYDRIRSSKKEYMDFVEEASTNSTTFQNKNSKQTTSDGISFHSEISRTTYFYRMGFFTTKTKAVERSKKRKWRKLGFTTTTMLTSNCGGKGNKQYDGYKTIVKAGALGGYKLLQFTPQIMLYKRNHTSIIDTSVLTGGSRSKTVSIGGNLGASEQGISAGISAGYTYSYDPNGLQIKNISGKNELQPNWICYKEKDDCEHNEWYQVTPMIIVKNPLGKKRTTKVSARVKNLLFSGTFKDYFIPNHSGSEYVSMTIKNHKLVSFHK